MQPALGRERKAVVLGMLLLILVRLPALDVARRGPPDRRGQPRQPVITLDSLGRMAPINDTSNSVIPAEDERANE
ncbi:MAG: hypothetical protein ACLR8Y_10460 [Alistipes indistinctus]